MLFMYKPNVFDVYYNVLLFTFPLKVQSECILDF